MFNCSVYSGCYAMSAEWANIVDTFLVNGSVNVFLPQR
jgi:hypothetical protein